MADRPRRGRSHVRPGERDPEGGRQGSTAAMTTPHLARSARVPGCALGRAPGRGRPGWSRGPSRLEAIHKRLGLGDGHPCRWSWRAAVARISPPWRRSACRLPKTVPGDSGSGRSRRSAPQVDRVSAQLAGANRLENPGSPRSSASVGCQSLPPQERGGIFSA